VTSNLVSDDTLRAWLNGAEENIESGVATDMVAVCPLALRRACRELIERRSRVETTVRRPGRIHINGLQLKHALDFVDQDDESELVIEHVDFERPDGNSPDETMPAGLYAWFYDYPDEGSLLLPESAVKTGCSGHSFDANGSEV
jgi:hypothetical protein